MTFCLFYVPKWFPKEIFRQPFWRLFGDLEAVRGKCDVRQYSHTSATLHPPKEAPKSDFFGVVFDTCLGSGLEGDILMQFDDFGLHLGVPGKTILDICAQGSILQFLFWFMVTKVKRFVEGSASEVEVMGDSFEVRRGSKYEFQHALLPAFGGAADIDVRSTAADPE